MVRTRRFAFLIALVLLFATAAYADGTGVTVAWDPNPEPDITQYIVYWGVQSRVYTSSVAVGTRTSWTITNLTPGQTYFFAVQATAADGLTSPFSDEVAATIPTPPAADTLPPALTVTSHQTGATVTSRSITLGGTASDAGRGDNGIASVSANGTTASSGTATGSGVASWSLPLALSNGSNVITVVARDGSANQNATATTLSITCDCPDIPAIRSFGSSSAFPAPVGASLTWTATAVGGTGPLQYRFYLYSVKNNSWSLLQDYSSANEVSWTPTENGTYALQAWVRSSGSTATYQDWRSSGIFAVGVEPQITGLDVQPARPVRVGETVTLTANASGGISPLQYQFWLFNATTGRWSLLRDYDTSNQAAFTPPAIGKYSVQAWVRNAGSTSKYDAWIGSPSIEATSRIIVQSLLPNVASPVSAGTPVTWTAVGGGAPNIEYKFWLFRKEDQRWVVLQDYGASNAVTWMPSQPGTYSVQVWAREVGSSAAWESWKGSDAYLVTVADTDLTITGLFFDHPMPLTVGTTVNVDVQSRGGTGPIQYQFWLYEGSGGKWSLLQDYSTSSRAPWTPAAPGSYAMQVWGRNEGSTSAYDAWKGTPTFNVTGVQVAISSFAPNVAFPVLSGTPVVWTAQAAASNGAPLEYQFWLHDGAAGTWTVLQSWGSSNTVAWTPLEPGIYHLQLWVRTVGSTANYEAWKGSADIVIR